jgi:transposase
MYYNGLSHKEAAKSVTNGTHKWCERGGIVGRGVLCDWLSWYEEKKGKAPSPVSRHEIPIEEIEETLKWQGITLKQGDIMMIRSGYVRWHKYVSC